MPLPAPSYHTITHHAPTWVIKSKASALRLNLTCYFLRAKAIARVSCSLLQFVAIYRGLLLFVYFLFALLFSPYYILLHPVTSCYILLHLTILYIYTYYILLHPVTSCYTLKHMYFIVTTNCRYVQSAILSRLLTNLYAVKQVY